jgi:GT2 family glycosyltransferase
MSYHLCAIEVTQPLPTLSLSPLETGVALLVRRHDRPVGFLMQALPAATVLTAEYIGQWIQTELGLKLLQEALQDEINDLIHSTPTISPASIPTITVAICTKDRPDYISACLKSLLAIAPPDAHRLEILVVDNAPSDDRTQQAVQSFPDVRYVQEPKPGLDFARNRAIQSATGEWLAFLDDDVEVDRGWLIGLQTALQENPDAAAITGLVLPYELETQAQILFEQRGGFRRGFEKIHYGKMLPSNSLYPCGAGIFGAGCNMAFRRQMLLELGGFDEALDTGAPLPGGGDLDMFYRVIRANYSLVYEPQYLVFHKHRREYDKLRRQYWSWGLGYMAFIYKSWRYDSAQRMQILRLIRWWFVDMGKQIKRSIQGKHPLPPALLLAELYGGIQGLFGEYERSSQRTEQIRRQF